VRPRILAVLIGLMLVVLVALGVPLATSYATSQGQSLFVDRVADTSRFASLAQQDDTDAGSPLLQAELLRYDELYGVRAAVVGTDGRVRIASRPALPLDGEHVAGPLRAALSGRPTEAAGPVWPWQDEPLVVAVPVVRSGDVIGAAVTLSPTDRTRDAVLRGWGLLAVGEILALLLGLLLVLRTTRWVLRPVHVLDATVHEITTGRLAARVTDGSGPPELRRLATSFNEMADHVEQVVEQQRDFVADASHQLRNPLNALLLRLDDLALRLPQPWAPEVATATEEGRHLARALESLLELARAEHAHAAPQPVDVVALVDPRLAAWRVVAQRRRIALERTGARTAMAVVGQHALQGALDVVLDNALKFGPEGSRVVVDVSGPQPRTDRETDRGSEPGAARGPDEVVVSVRDEGPGLEEDELERAGDRFWRSRRHQNVDGSGLGLAIARTLLAPSHGRLEVTPNDPHGLCVLLRLPALVPAGTAATGSGLPKAVPGARA
jgi:signal transduction histidine kinase